MTGDRATERMGVQRAAGATGGAVLVLACMACQQVYEPSVADFGSGSTGCPWCGGWTWVAQLGPAEWSAGSGSERLAPRQQAFDGTCPDLAVTPPRTPAGSGSPTTSR